LADLRIPEWLRRKEANGERASRENIRRWSDPSYRARVAASIARAWRKPGSRLAGTRGHRKRSKWSLHIEAMRDMRRQGYSYAAIARRFGCSDHVPLRWARTGKSVKPLPHISVIQCVKLRKRGLTIARIARILGCSTATVDRRLRGRQPHKPRAGLA
jgi:transposase-like protein